MATTGTILVAGAALFLAGCAAPAPLTGDPRVDSLTPEERIRYDYDIEMMAEFYQVEDPPHYEVVRWVLAEEADDARVPCMAELGFEREEDGSYDFGQQKKAFDAAMYQCFAQYPNDPKYSAPWGDEQLEAQYRWSIEVITPCIEAAGVTLSAPPSLSVFIESWPTDPYWPMSEVPNSRWSQIEDACPIQQAPAQVLWDGVEPTEHPRAR